MSKMRGWKLSLTCAASLALLAVSTPAYSQEDVSFLVIDYDAPGMGDWWKKLVAAYEEKTGNKIALRGTTASDYYQQLLIEAASGTGADILTINPNNVQELIPTGQVLPLDDFVDKSGLRDRLVDGAWEKMSVGGKIYGLPVTGRTLELIYNECMLKEAGLSAPPTTPEQFLDYARKLTKRDASGDVTQYGANMVNAQEDPTYEMLLMWSIAHGGSFADADGKFTVNSEPVVKALKFMKVLYDEGLVPRGLSETDQRSLFASGRTAMTIDGQWQFPFIEKNNAANYHCYKSARHPWEGPGTGGVNMAIGVNAAAANPEAAWAFIELAASEELQAAFSDHSPFVPFAKNALTAEQLAKKPYLQPWVDSIGTAHPVAIPGHEDQFNEIWPVIVDAVLLTLRDGVAAEESLAKAQAQLEECCSK